MNRQWSTQTFYKKKKKCHQKNLPFKNETNLALITINLLSICYRISISETEVEYRVIGHVTVPHCDFFFSPITFFGKIVPVGTCLSISLLKINK